VQVRIIKTFRSGDVMLAQPLHFAHQDLPLTSRFSGMAQFGISCETHIPRS
jgi:hypothetical protein